MRKFGATLAILTMIAVAVGFWMNTGETLPDGNIGPPVVEGFNEITQEVEANAGLLGPRTIDGQIGIPPTNAEVIGGCVALRAADWDWWQIPDQTSIDHRITAASLIVAAKGGNLEAYCKYREP